MFLVELLTLDAPYAGIDQKDYNAMILKGELPPNLPKTGKAFELIRKCCQVTPGQRPAAEEIVSYLNPLGQ